ncbi:Transposase [Bacteroidales bacterium Barb7]|nr:Transposase [Bacteroidales bacterium Barb7]
MLGQRKTGTKSNEIPVIPEWLELLELKGSIVTIDAAGTQTSVAEKIIEKEADYVLAVKNNQKTVRAEMPFLTAKCE